MNQLMFESDLTKARATNLPSKNPYGDNINSQLKLVALGMMNYLKSSDSHYCIPTSNITFTEFNPDQVNIWGADLEQMLEAVPFLEGELSKDERQRAKCFHFDINRCQFIIARSLLRLILGQCLGQKPSQIRFVKNAYGKPSMVGSMVEFNLSHSGKWIFYAFSACHAIGIDIEKINAKICIDLIDENIFSPREKEILKLYPNDFVDNFFTYWTCKEAVLKGMGRGITRDLQKLDLSCMANERSCAFMFSVVGGCGEFWTIARLNNLEGYVGAVALNCIEKQLVYREFTKETLNSVFKK